MHLLLVINLKLVHLKNSYKKQGTPKINQLKSHTTYDTLDLSKRQMKTSYVRTTLKMQFYIKKKTKNMRTRTFNEVINIISQKKCKILRTHKIF